MYSLAEIQAKLRDNILGAENSLLFIKDSGSITSNDRFAIHRDTVLENLIVSLQITYPGIWRLIGEDCARGVALAYIHDCHNLTNRAEMDDFGKNFPEFLRNFISTKHLKYLPDFARLELLRSKSYRATNQTSIDLKILQSYFESGIESCRLILNDSVFFLRSKYPLANIQQLLDDTNSSELSLQEEDCFIMICRVDGKTETLYLDRKSWQFLFNLGQGNLVGEAMDIFTEEELATEIQPIIRLILDKQIITKIQE